MPPNSHQELTPAEQSVVQYRPLAYKLAHQHARTDADVDDLASTALYDLFLAWQRTTPTHPHGFARTVLRRSMLAYYRGGRVCRRAGRDTLLISLEDPGLPSTHHALVVPAPRHEERLDLEAFFTALRAALGEQACVVVANLIAPRDPRLCKYIVEEAQSKAHRKRTTGAQLRGIEHLRVSRRQVRRALGISRPQWRELIRGITLFTQQWLDATAAVA